MIAQFSTPLKPFHSDFRNIGEMTTMEWLKQDDVGVRVRCRVQPSASKTAVLGTHDGALKISLAAPPVDGKANKALRAFIAKKLSISKSSVSLVSGEKSKNKTLVCVGVTPEQAQSLLD
jgi:uncharacterized protein (TIGR00251 family)